MSIFNSVLAPLYNAVSWVLLTFHKGWSHIFAPSSGAKMLSLIHI